MDDNCLFCKIIKGEIPSTKVYEDDKTYAFRDINPEAPVHVLVVPKKHISDLMHVEMEDKEYTCAMFNAIKEVAKAENIEESGFRIISNNGENAGQSVGHLHIHVVGGKKLGTNVV